MASRRHPVLASVGALLALVALLGCAARLLPESRRHPVLASVGALLALVALLGCAARLLPEDMQALPYVPYVIALSPWFALAAMVSLVCACIAHRWFTAAVAVACIVLQGYWQLPFYRNGEPLGAQAIAAVAQAKPATDDAFARVMTCNVYKGAADPQAIVDAVRDQHVEVLALQETTPQFVQRLEQAGIGDYLPYAVSASSGSGYIVDAVRDQHVEVLALQETTPQFVQRLEQAGIGDYLPYAVSASSGSGYGNGLWSAQPLQQPADQETTPQFVQRLEQAGIGDYLPYAVSASSGSGYGNGLWSAQPLQQPADAEFPSSASAMPAGTIRFDNGALPVRFVSVHTTSPTAQSWDLWRKSLTEMQQLTARTGTQYVLMGDFNATYDHAVFRDLLGSRFQDAARASGHGLVFSWPADKPWLPAFSGIDHIVTERGVVVGQVSTMRIGGSDHRALLATLDFTRR